ncbi:retrovirus-related pol polyprotein from transposon TNT 1-94 [Tanacetum coccineum]
MKYFELASLFGKLKYEENLIDSIYEIEKEKSLVSATPLSTAFFSNFVAQDFQDSPDDGEDTRSSQEYLNDLDEEYQARALLAKSKRFFKKGTQRFNNAKETDQTECYKCGKKGYFARDSYEWDEEEVLLDDNDMVEVKVLMALAKDNDVVSKEGARNGEWVKISMRKAKRPSLCISSADDTKVSIPSVERPWLSEAEGFILPNHYTGRMLPTESQRNTTGPPVAVTDSLATDYDSADESSICSTPLPPLKKLDGAEPVFGPNTIKSLLRSKSIFKAETLKGVIINEPSSTPARGNKSTSASKVNSTPAGKLKSVKIKDDLPLAIVMKELNDLKLQISKNQSSYSKNNQPQQCERTDHRTCDHAEYMSTMNMSKHLKNQGGSSSRSRTSRPSKLFFPPCIHFHTTTNHNDIERFRRGEALQAKKAEGLKSTKDESSNANRSKTPTKSQDLRWCLDMTLHAQLKVMALSNVMFDEKIENIFNSNKEVVMINPRDNPCSSCEKGKHHRASFKTKQTFSIKKCLHLLHMDLFRPVTPKSINHEKYTLVIVDEYSRDFSKFPSPYTPKQNGIVERKNRTLIEAARTMLPGSVFSKKYWNEAIATACYTQNRSTIVKRILKTPYEIFCKRITNIDFLHVFGCPVFIHNHKDHFGKFDEKADDGYFLGYSHVSKSFRVFNIRRQKTEETYHITFDEIPDAIKFTKLLDDNIYIAKSERYPPDEYLHPYEPSQRYQTNSNEVSFTEPYKSLDPVVLETEVSFDQNGQADQNDLNDQNDQSAQTDEILNDDESEHSDHTNDEYIIDNFPTTEDIQISKHLSSPNVEDTSVQDTIPIPNPSLYIPSMTSPAPQDRWFQEKHIELVNIIDFLSKEEPKKVSEVLHHLGWVDAMQDELNQFSRNKIKQSERCISINYEKYVKDQLKKYDINGSSVKTPMVPPNKLVPDLNGKAVNETQYRGMIGSLMYLTSSRPDIQFSTCLCARYQANPKESHLIVVKRIFRYLKEKALQRSYSQRDIELHFIPTQYQIVDILTKPPNEPTFKRLIVKLGCDTLADSTAKADPGISDPNDFISEQQDQTKSARDGLNTAHTDLARPSYPDINQLTELLVTSLKPELSKLLASHDFASCLPTKLKELPSKITKLFGEVKELKKHELLVEFLGLPSQISLVQEKLKTLYTLPSILHKVTNTLNKFATIMENASSKATDKGVPTQKVVNKFALPEKINEQKRIKETLKAKLAKQEVEKVKSELVDLLGIDVMTREDGSTEVISNLKVGDLHLAEGRENGIVRPKTYEELSDKEKLQADCDLKATNIVLQGLPPDVYVLVNHHKVGKDIWDRVKLLMQGTSLSKQEHEYLGHVVPTFLPGDDPIACMNKEMEFMSAVFSLRYPSTNNQLRSSSNLRNQATVQDGRVTVQQVQGRQGEWHMARQCTQPKRRKDAARFKEKVLLVQAHAEAFQTDDLDAYDSDCDDISSAKEVLRANLSICDSDVLFEVPYSNNSHNDVMNQAAELEKYKERFKILEQRFNVDLSSREKFIGHTPPRRKHEA